MAEMKLSKRRGFLNGDTAEAHEYILMSDILFDRALKDIEATEDAREAGLRIMRTFELLNPAPVSFNVHRVDWVGIAKSFSGTL